MRTVLVIDDNPAVGEAISLLLSLREITTMTALTTGHELQRRHDLGR